MCYQHIIRRSKSVYGLIKFSPHVFKYELPAPSPCSSTAEHSAHFQCTQVWLHLRTLLIGHNGSVSARRPNELNQFHFVIKNLELVTWVLYVRLHPSSRFGWALCLVESRGEVLAHVHRMPEAPACTQTDMIKGSQQETLTVAGLVEF